MNNECRVSVTALENFAKDVSDLKKQIESKVGENGKFSEIIADLNKNGITDASGNITASIKKIEAAYLNAANKIDEVYNQLNKKIAEMSSTVSTNTSGIQDDANANANADYSINDFYS